MSLINLERLVLCPTTEEGKLTAIISATGHSDAEHLTPGEVIFFFHLALLTVLSVMRVEYRNTA